MASLSSRLKELQEKIDARIFRERVMILVAGLAVVFMAWNFLIQSSFDKSIADVNAQLTALSTQGAAIQTQITATTQMLMNDPNKPKKAQITELQTEIGTVETELQGASQSLIKADQLPLALQQVLQKTTQLTLLEATTLPAHELKLAEVISDKANQPANSATVKAAAAGVFEHAVILRVSGNYFQVVQFLTALEQLPWRFYWQSLDYKVVEYPNAEIKLRVYTLSSEEGLLGV